MSKDDNMLIILGRPFLNTTGAVIDCNKGNVTFHVNGNEHTVHFPKKQPQVHSINSIEKNSTIIIGDFEFPLPIVKKQYDILIVGDMHIPIDVTFRVDGFSYKKLFHRRSYAKIMAILPKHGGLLQPGGL